MATLELSLFNNPSLNFNNDLHIDTTLLLMAILKTLSIPHFENFGEFSVDKVQAICKILDMSDSKYFQSTSKGYIDRKLNGKTALYLAAEMGHAGIVQYLRTKDALVEETGPSACPSAIIIAAKNKHFDVVNKLLESKGTFSSFTATITRKTIDQDGSTAIHYVAQSGSAQDIYNILFTSVNQATIKSPYGHRRDRQGFHALDCIVRRQDAETILRELITICGFNTNDNKRRNFFCLTFDIYKSTGSEFLSTFEYALLYKYNIAEMINQCLPKSFERTELEQQRLDLVGYRLDIARKIETMGPSTLATHFQPLIAAHQDTIIEQEASPATSSYQQQALSFSLFSENESSQEAELQRLKSELTKITRIINQKISQVNEQAKKLNKRNDDSARNIYLCIGLSCLLLIAAFLISSIFLLLAAISCILIIGALIETPDTPHIKDIELGRQFCTP